MRQRLSDLPELPAEPHDFFLLPVRRLELPGGAGLTYRRVGRGRPVLLLPGLWTTAYAFRGLIGPLSGRLELILPELTEASGANPLAVEDYRPVKLGELARTIIERLGLERPVVVGHAEAGLAALELAMDRPDGLQAVVLVGAAIGLPAARRLAGLWLGRAQGRSWARAAFAQPDRAALAMLRYADPAVASRQEVRQLARGWATLPGARARARILSRTLTPGYARPTLERLAAFVETRGEPGLALKLVYGQRDPWASPEQGQRLNRLVPGSELLVAERSAGAVQVERPRFLARVIARAAGLGEDP